MLGNLIGKVTGRDPLIGAYVRAYIKSSRVPDFEKTEAGQAILKLEPSRQVDILCAAFEGIGKALRNWYVAFQEKERSHPSIDRTA